MTTATDEAKPADLFDLPVEPLADEPDAAPMATLPPYPAYKPSGVDWLGDVPAGWDVRRLKHAVSLVTDKVDAEDANGRYVGLEHVESWTGRLVEAARDDAEDDDEAESGGSRFAADDVLFGKLRPYLAKVHQAAEAGVCSTELLVLRGRAMMPRFLMYHLLTPGFIEVVDGSTYGTKMPRANWQAIGNLPIPLPPLAEQRGIAGFLDRATARVDALVAKKRRLLGLLAEKRQALITHAVTRGLDPHAPTRPTAINWLGDVPEHWEVKQVRHLTPPGRRVMYGIVLPGPDVSDGVHIVKAHNCAPGHLKPELMSKTTHEIESGYERSRLREGDIVYGIRGTVGAAEIVPPELVGANLTQDAARISPGEGIEPRWLLYAVRSSAFFAELESGMTGTGVKGINIRDLKKGHLAVPPPEEQRTLVAHLDAATARLDELSAKVAAAIGRLAEYRAALITAAVTGRVDVRGLFGDDG